MTLLAIATEVAIGLIAAEFTIVLGKPAEPGAHG